AHQLPSFPARRSSGRAMKVLIIGSGGREHALAWKVAQSPRVELVYVAPCNAGTALEPRVQSVDIAADDVPALVEFAKRERIGLRSEEHTSEPQSRETL